MNSMIRSFLANVGELSVAKKTTLLFMIMVTGMLFIGSFAHLSLNRIKNEFDVLYNKHTVPVIKLEALKDIYTVNILDTLREIEEHAVSIHDGKRVIFLAQGLIHRYWEEYEESVKIDESDWVVQTFRSWGLIPEAPKETMSKLKQDLIARTDTRVLKIDTILKEMFEQFEVHETDKAFELLQASLYPAIHSVNIHLTQLINFSLEAANAGKERTDAVYTRTFAWIVAGVVGTIGVAALFALVILQNIRLLYANLEEVVEEKTKELVTLNRSLEKRVAKEIDQSRQKDEIMYRQSRHAAMGEMIGNIAHQWRQPLNALTLLIQSFQTKQMHGKLDEAFVDAQVQEGLLLANAMSKTIDDFRNFFHSGKEHKLFNVGDNIASTINMLRTFYAKEGIDIVLTCKEEQRVLGHPSEFSQVMMNLFSNAKDALLKQPLPRFIEVVVSGDALTCNVEVFDNGGGIPAHVIERIFDPYFTTKHQASGTGIGLYMSKQIIEKQMNGSIAAANVAHSFQGKLCPICACITLTISKKQS
jgi:signal transduction histidine kinase